MTAPITLEEYQSITVGLSLEQVRAVRATAQRSLSITATDVPGQWTVRAAAHVGTINTAGVKILIRPKVSDANLFHLLEAGGDPLEVRPETFEYKTSSDLVPAFATFFVRLVERGLARGLHRAYEEHEELVVGVRGRVDVGQQSRRAGLPLPVQCRFDEYTADIPTNRIIKGAASRLYRMPGVSPQTRLALGSILVRLEEVSALRQSDLFVPPVFTRLNNHLRPAHRLALMVLRGTSLTDRVGDAEAGAFLVNMNLVLEEFVEARLRSYLPGDLTLVGQHHGFLDVTRDVVPIRPDLVVHSRGQPVFVGDAKYKLLLDEERGRNPDYYQLLAYATALNVSEGVLVYCHDDGVAPAPITVAHSGTRIFVRGIRLNGTPLEVDAQIQSLAAWISTRCDAAKGTPAPA